MNETCAWAATSLRPAYELVQDATVQFAHTWEHSIELRVAVFVMVLQCCFMAWVTSMVREILRTCTTVLGSLLLCDSAASSLQRNHTSSTASPASVNDTPYKTKGGPPPVPPPS